MLIHLVTCNPRSSSSSTEAHPLVLPEAAQQELHAAMQAADVSTSDAPVLPTAGPVRGGSQHSKAPAPKASRFHDDCGVQGFRMCSAMAANATFASFLWKRDLPSLYLLITEASRPGPFTRGASFRLMPR